MITLGNIPITGKVIDITVPISSSTRVYPGDPEPLIESVCTLEADGCAVSKLSFGSHTGTHVDAPAHVLEAGKPVDGLELEGLMGRALVLDFSSKTGALSRVILESAFRKAGRSEGITVLLLKTTFEEPVYLEESAAAWIVESGFTTVGIDSFSVDCLASEDFPAHRILLSNGVNIVECLDLGTVEAGTYFFLCLPLKIEGCDGAPARAVLISGQGL